ncbi:MAG: SH3 domain-containing protein [Gemmatimonadaceae bacterium]
MRLRSFGFKIATPLAFAIVAIANVAIASKVHAQEPNVLRRARVNPNNPIDFHAAVSPETLYVGQQATYQIAVFLEDVAVTRLRRNPEFLPPEYRGLLAYDIGSTQAFPSREVSGKHYTARVFEKALFPLASGTLTVPSPQLSYSLPQSSSYFSREESHVVRAESTTLFVKPIPTVGRPVDYTGAVGILKAAVHLDASSARVGDPLVLTLRVQGTGNIKLLPRPTLEVEWASSVSGTERLQLDTTGLIVKGFKEFDWILTPAREGDVQTPAIHYSYFNPYTEKFEVTEAAAFPISVQAGSLVTADSGNDVVAQIPLRGHVVGEVGVLPPDNLSLLMLCALMPLPALALLLLGIPKTREKAPAIDSLRSLALKPLPQRAQLKEAANEKPTSPRDVRRLLLSSLAKRLDASSDVLNERSRTERLLRRRGVTRETTRDILAQLAKLDIASFASQNVVDVIDSPNTSDTIAFAIATQVATLTSESLALYDRVDGEALLSVKSRSRKVKLAGRMSLVLLLVAAGSAAIPPASQAQDASPSAWEAASTAYKNRQFGLAANGFKTIAAQLPRDADALSNWATSAWAASDTVSAVIGWQRAVRLDPLAADLREHMLMLPAGAREGVAEVPLVPVTLLGYGGTVAWVVAWVALTWILWRRRAKKAPMPVVRNAALVVVVLSAACIGISFLGARQLRTVGLAVVVRPETIRSGPDVDADALGGAATGDIVRVKQRQQLWSLVLHADGREGWIPSDRITALGANEAQ